jgi:hypothetical protein
VRRVVLHVGTHKTGTKTLQLFTAVNRDALERLGVYVPRAGRVELQERTFSPGHHQVAWDAMYGADPVALRELCAEIASKSAPLAFVSSEDFEYLIGPQAPLAGVRSAIEQTGADVVALVYFRRQDSYAESTYAQFIRGGVVRPVRVFLEEILERGHFDPFESPLYIGFDYREVIHGLGSIFGFERIVARPWRANPDPAWLPQDLLRVFSRVGGSPVDGNLEIPVPFANPRDTLGTVLETARAAYKDRDVPAAVDVVDELFPEKRPLLDRRFLMLDRSESLAVLERFAASNAYLRTNAGCDIGFEDAGHVAPAEHPHWQDAAEQRQVLDAVLERFAQSGEARTSTS